MVGAQADLQERFASYVGEGVRTRTTVRETAAEFARYTKMRTAGSVLLKEGSLLAVYASMASEDAPEVASELPDAVRLSYRAAYGGEPPYNWTGEIANPRDITSTPAGP